ncbi:hypothetical protein ACOZ4I_02315 [Haloarcula salina]|uniref:hypothetical protein n=1 Tax=Haloarcula salina TaxID=1429914 RepID=UPI003C6FCEC6
MSESQDRQSAVERTEVHTLARHPVHIIDEDGGLFGLINAIDELTILEVLTILTVDATLVINGSNGGFEQTETKLFRYATISYAITSPSNATAVGTGIPTSGSDETF